MIRKFEARDGVRSKVPLLVGVTGASSSGKTFSMLRIAVGMQRITGGNIHVIDTESGRALHYADRFRFKHVPMEPPYNPLSYLHAIEFCAEQGPGPIIVDQLSYEHDGCGGVLEIHAAEVDRLAGDDWKKAERVKMLCWQKPKAERRKLINALVQMSRCIIFGFRAKEKLKMEKGKDPVPLGFMPICGEEFQYELTANALLMPCSGGVPTWQSIEIGEKQIIKMPDQFRSHFASKSGPLDEADGEFMARWASGVPAAPVATFEEITAELAAVKTLEDLNKVKAMANASRQRLTKDQSEQLRLEFQQASDDIAALAATA